MPVLIVDDDQDIRGAVADVLSSEGFQVFEAQNGREALSILEKHQPCVVVLDLMMPVMNGWEFLAERRRRRELARIPVIVATAHAQADVEADRVLRKPFDIDKLIQAVRELAPGGEHARA